MNYYYSNVYWHFTGSPKNIDWSTVSCPNDIKAKGNPKDDFECLEIIEKILDTKLLLAKCTEKVDDHISTEPFCCITDIPIQNLEEHTQFYGNFAIGFKHFKVHKYFNPVLYISKRALKVRLKTPEEAPSRGLFTGIFNPPKNKSKHSGIFAAIFRGFLVDETQLGSYIHNHFKITQFSDNPGDTFYREREWRKIGDFNFEYDDIAGIIVPSSYLAATQKLILKYNIDNIPILTWELLSKL